MNMEDMCLCASEECPHYNECWRGGLTTRKGIYTMSYLAEVCNEKNEYECWIKEDEE